jgi:hypothetical protein
MKQFLAILLITSFLMTSCKKDDNGSGGSGNPGGAYLTLEAGKIRNYETNLSGNTSNYSLNTTDSFEFQNGRQYRILRRSTGEKELYAVSGSDYYKWDSWALPGSNFENRYLIENYPLNNSWNAGNIIIDIDTTITQFNAGIDATIRYNNKIVDNNATITVNGRTYNNVVHVETVPTVVSLGINVLGFPLPGATLDLNGSSINSYYAKQYGLILDSVLVNGVLNIPPIPTILDTAITIPLNNFINSSTRLISANF